MAKPLATLDEKRLLQKYSGVIKLIFKAVMKIMLMLIE